MLQKDLAAAIKNGNDCKKAVFDTLQAKLLPATVSAPKKRRRGAKVRIVPRVRTPPSNRDTNAVYCVLVINGNASSETPVVQTCGLSDAQAQRAVRGNLKAAEENLDRLLNAKSDYFFPALENYRNEPSKASWAVVLDQAQMIQKLIVIAVDSLVQIDPSTRHQLGNKLGDISGHLMSRAVTIYALGNYSDPPSPTGISRIEQQQRALYEQLRRELAKLRADLAP